MASKRPSKRSRLQELLQQRRTSLLDEAFWREAKDALAPVSDSYLRELLRGCGVPLAPLVEGVRQGNFEELERTLLSIAREYESGDRERRQRCRAAVITAKDHARFALRRPGVAPERKAEKEEMLLWIQTWLENPGVFPDWLALRKRVVGLSPPREDSY